MGTARPTGDGGFSFLLLVFAEHLRCLVLGKLHQESLLLVNGGHLPEIPVPRCQPRASPESRPLSQACCVHSFLYKVERGGHEAGGRQGPCHGGLLGRTGLDPGLDGAMDKW